MEEAPACGEFKALRSPNLVFANLGPTGLKASWMLPALWVF